LKLWFIWKKTDFLIVRFLTEIVSRTFHLKTGLSGQKPDVATQMEDDEYDPRQLQVP